jgi:hypothetical protein
MPKEIAGDRANPDEFRGEPFDWIQLPGDTAMSPPTVNPDQRHSLHRQAEHQPRTAICADTFNMADWPSFEQNYEPERT